eukprot:3835964-Pyramimonas_sp.AAC.1
MDAHDACPVKCVSAADCTSLYDAIAIGNVSATDRIFSLGAAILRQSLEEVSIQWVKSEQVLADCLTK